jgi:hypothetical protein
MYDDAKFGLEQTAVIHLPAPTTNDADEVVLRLQFFTKTKILEARAMVVGTAYDEATATFEIYKDDGSIGNIILTTESVGTTVDASLADTTFDSTNSLEIQQTHATATGLCDLMIQYQEMFE